MANQINKIDEKTYSTKSTARRGAKRAYGESWEGDFEVLQNDDGRWYVAALDIAEVMNEINNEDTVEPVNSVELIDTEIDINIDTDTEDEAKPAIKRKSEIDDPCQFVWEMADKMQGQRRKDIIQHCVDCGVAFYTARTQYQSWFKSKKAE